MPAPPYSSGTVIPSSPSSPISRHSSAGNRFARSISAAIGATRSCAQPRTSLAQRLDILAEGEVQRGHEHRRFLPRLCGSRDARGARKASARAMRTALTKMNPFEINALLQFRVRNTLGPRPRTRYKPLVIPGGCACAQAEVTRKTAETELSVALDLDGTGRHDNQTGVGFFDHMLDQLARHALIDLDDPRHRRPAHRRPPHRRGRRHRARPRPRPGPRRQARHPPLRLLPPRPWTRPWSAPPSTSPGRPFLVWKVDFPTPEDRHLRHRARPRVLHRPRDERRPHPQRRAASTAPTATTSPRPASRPSPGRCAPPSSPTRAAPPPSPPPRARSRNDHDHRRLRQRQPALGAEELPAHGRRDRRRPGRRHRRPRRRPRAPTASSCPASAPSPTAAPASPPSPASSRRSRSACIRRRRPLPRHLRRPADAWPTAAASTARHPRLRLDPRRGRPHRARRPRAQDPAHGLERARNPRAPPAPRRHRHRRPRLFRPLLPPGARRPGPPHRRPSTTAARSPPSSPATTSPAPSSTRRRARPPASA